MMLTQGEHTQDDLIGSKRFGLDDDWSSWIPWYKIPMGNVSRVGKYWNVRAYAKLRIIPTTFQRNPTISDECLPHMMKFDSFVFY